jgi:hypothetical protein
MGRENSHSGNGRRSKQMNLRWQARGRADSPELDPALRGIKTDFLLGISTK